MRRRTRGKASNGLFARGLLHRDVLKENLATTTIAEGHQSHAHATITELFNNLTNSSTMHLAHNVLDLIVADIEVGAGLDGQATIFCIYRTETAR